MCRLFTNFISEETFDEIILIGDMNCDAETGRFFHELKSMLTLHSHHWTDIEQHSAFSCA